MILQLLLACRSLAPSVSTTTEPAASPTQAPHSTADTSALVVADTSDSAATNATADPAGTAPWDDDDRYILVDEVGDDVRPLDPDEWPFGAALAAGVDLDHDGVQEWALSAPRNNYDASPEAVVRIYEDSELLTERHPRDYLWDDDYGRLMAGGDVTGDGYGDLVFTQSNGGHGRLRVVSALDEATDSHTAPVDVDFMGMPFAGNVWTFAILPGGDLLSVWFQTSRHVMFRSLAPLSPSSVEEPHRIADEGHVLMEDWNSDPETSTGLYDPAALPGEALFTMGKLMSDDGWEAAELLSCPLALNSSLAECDVIASREGHPIAGRVRQLGVDGITVLASSGAATRDEHGAVYLYDLDGTELAVIQGTQLAQLGKPIFNLVDDHGDAWLLVGQNNIPGGRVAELYAFRATDLHGDLTEADAERIYASTRGFSFTAVQAYRPTADAPLQLLLSDTYDGGSGGVVWKLPFDPPGFVPPPDDTTGRERRRSNVDP